ncbi:sorting nexin-3/12 [Pelomyxa schiedti]|nr:sorting nexin-3/12 [Pelomyxa schiedti]
MAMKSKASTPMDGDYHEPEYISIYVTDPVTVQDGTGTFTRYKVATETTFPEYKKGRNFFVYRRYKQFVMLSDHLKERLAANPRNIKFGDVPPLPGNTVGSLFNLGNSRFDTEFLEERRKGLEDFINVVAKHNAFRFEPALHNFLQNDDFTQPL